MVRTVNAVELTAALRLQLSLECRECHADATCRGFCAIFVSSNSAQPAISLVTRRGLIRNMPSQLLDAHICSAPSAGKERRHTKTAIVLTVPSHI